MRSNYIKNAFYHLRMMVALAVSLVIVTLCFKLPLRFDPAPKPWEPHVHPYGFNTGTELATFSLSVTPAQSAKSPAGKASDGLMSEIAMIKEEPVSENSDGSRIPELGTVPVLDYAEIMPEIRGGLGAYYILIEYPEEAISQGIEGRLALTFTVNRDGTTSDIVVSEPVHSLLDSAAVQALRRTRFIPGQHLGESARVRMRLPVRFELVEPTDSTRTESESAK